MTLTDGLTQRHPLPPSARRLRTEKDEINGSVWAWFNPASVIWHGQRWLAYRTECSPRWHWSRISIARLNEDGSVIAGSNKLLNLPTDFGKWGAEDPRLTVWHDRLLLTYYDGWKTAIAELDEDGRIIKARIFREKKIVESIAFDKDQREKNWGFFGRGDGLFVSYWTAPHVVFRYDERRGRLGEQWQSAWSVPANVGQLHGGSSPVMHDGLIWRVVHSHRVIENDILRYQLWLMAFAAKPPFKPVWFCTLPLVIAEREKTPLREQVYHDVVFCGSAERTPEGWLIFFGENDPRIRHGVVPDALITPHLKAVR